MRGSKTKNITLAVIMITLIVGVISYLIILSKEKNVESKIEYSLEMKKNAYKNYIESMKEINIATDVETAIRVIEESEDVLNNISDDEQLGKYYKEFKEGNDYIDALEEVAIKNLNSAIPALYETDNMTLPQYKSIEDIKDSEYLSSENKSILYVMEERIYERSGVYIGMTKEEVLRTEWGKPIDINRTITSNSISEQWVYSKYKYLYFEDGVLTTIQD